MLAADAARHLAVGADRITMTRVLVAGGLHGAPEPLRDREHADEHDDHADDAEDGDRGGAEPLPDGAQVDAGDGDYLGTSSASPQRVHDLQPAGLERRDQPGRDPERGTIADAERHVAPRQIQRRHHAVRRIARHTR